MQITNRCTGGLVAFMVSIYVTFPSYFFSANTVRFVPVQFRSADAPILQSNSCDPFQLSPAAGSVHFTQPLHFADRRLDGDCFNDASMYVAAVNTVVRHTHPHRSRGGCTSEDRCGHPADS